MTEIIVSSSKNLQKYISEIGIIPRKDAGPGLWLSVLLPTAVIIGDLKHSATSLKYRVAACVCCGLLAHSIFLVYKLKQNSFQRTTIAIASSLIASLILYFMTEEGLLFSCGYGFLSVISYEKMLLPLMKLCPKSFTYGEVTAVTQGLILFLISSLIRNTDSSGDCMTISTTILQVGILCIISIGILAYAQNLNRKPMQYYCIFLFVIGFILLPLLHIILEENPLSWVLHLINEDDSSVQLFVYWLLCTMIGIITIAIQVKRNEKASTVLRKVFHILVVLVFIPGIISKPCLIYFASGVTFALFICLDMLRVLNLPPLGTTLQASFDVFADEKDEGPISLTPLYLLAGCALPIWIHPNPIKAELLPLLSGLLAVGIGDTAASICGSLVGKNKWRGSHKTKEGTAACFLSQLFCIIALIHYGYVPRTNLIKPTFAVAVTSLVEAKTDQIDNLSLPLLMYIFLL